MTDPKEKPLHVVELRSSNIKRLRAVRVRPDGGPVVLIGGENGQGKSSLLDSIEMALRGAKGIPLEPVRHGARSAAIELDMGEFKVERSFTAKGSELIVRDKEGIPQASPQRLLDKLCAQIAFDPLEFMRMEAPKQDVLLKKMLGLDFSDIEQKRAKAYEERTNANREVKRLEMLVEEKEADALDAPAELVDVAALSEQLQAHTNAVGSLNTLKALIGADNEKLRALDVDIEDLEERLAERRARRAAFCADIEKRTRELPPEPSPIDDVRTKLRNAENTNAKVRAKQEYERVQKQLETAEVKARELNEAIEDLDGVKAERLAAAKSPIAGLGFDEAGPTFNGVPLAQASQAEQLRVSVAIGAAQDPRIRVMLVREGSRLDKKSLELLAELAKETGSQVWVERVSDGDQGAIIIEDGMVRAPVAEETAGAA